jgi:cbb3-type cytochrome oxidase subunit 3
MGAVRLAFRAELRRRWRSWLTIALLIAFIGATVLGLWRPGGARQPRSPACSR